MTVAGQEISPAPVFLGANPACVSYAGRRQLVALYLGRLPADLAAREAARVNAGELHFAWEGPTSPGQRHYYRVQGDDLLIEYDNTTSDGNHAHTVLRRPRSDFGSDVLAAHYRQAHS